MASVRFYGTAAVRYHAQTPDPVLLQLQKSHLAPAHVQAHHHYQGESHYTPVGANCAARLNEGCPCCVAAVDLDEIAGGANAMKDVKGAPKGITANADSTNIGIGIGVGYLGLVGMIFGIQNGLGAWRTLQTLKQNYLPNIEDQLVAARVACKEATGTVIAAAQDRFQNIAAYRITLHQSVGLQRFFIGFAGAVPFGAGALTFASCFFPPLALAGLALTCLYCLAHVLRYATHELPRFWRATLASIDPSYNSLTHAQRGAEEFEHVMAKRRVFYAMTTVAFAVGAVGTSLSFVGMLALFTPAAPAGAALLLVGALIACIGIGGTVFLNNCSVIKQASPKNDDTEIDRANLGSFNSILQKIGELSEESDNAHALKHRLRDVELPPSARWDLYKRSFWHRLLTVFPGYIPTFGVPIPKIGSLPQRFSSIRHRRRQQMLDYTQDHLAVNLMQFVADSAKTRDLLQFNKIANKQIAAYSQKLADSSEAEQTAIIWAYLRAIGELDNVVAACANRVAEEPTIFCEWEKWLKPLTPSDESTLVYQQLDVNALLTSASNNDPKARAVVRQFLQITALHLIYQYGESELNFRRLALIDHARARLSMTSALNEDNHDS